MTILDARNLLLHEITQQRDEWEGRAKALAVVLEDIETRLARDVTPGFIQRAVFENLQPADVFGYFKLIDTITGALKEYACQTKGPTEPGPHVAWSWDNETFHGPFNSIREAVAAAAAAAENPHMTYVFIGAAIPHEPDLGADRIISLLQDDASDNAPCDAAHDFLTDATPQARAVLGKLLNGALQWWLREFNLGPHFFSVTDTQFLDIKEELTKS